MIEAHSRPDWQLRDEVTILQTAIVGRILVHKGLYWTGYGMVHYGGVFVWCDISGVYWNMGTTSSTPE